MVYSYDDFLLELGAKLRRMRIERGWTLRSMIIDHGFHLAQWQAFEKGKGMSIPTLMRLCDLFDLTIEELIGGMGQVAQPAASKGLAPAETSPQSLPRIAKVTSKAKKIPPTRKAGAKTAR